MCNIYKEFDVCCSPVDTHEAGEIARILNDRMLPHAPIKHVRGQNKVFPNQITFGVLLFRDIVHALVLLIKVQINSNASAQTTNWSDGKVSGPMPILQH